MRFKGISIYWKKIDFFVFFFFFILLTGIEITGAIVLLFSMKDEKEEMLKFLLSKKYKWGELLAFSGFILRVRFDNFRSRFLFLLQFKQTD